MKMTDLRAKARAIFGPAIAEPMPKQPNGAKALQERANARPIPTYKVGGAVKKQTPPGPTPAERESARRFRESVSKLKPTKEEGEAIKRGNRAAAVEGGRYKTGGSVHTSADTAKKLATEMGGMKDGGNAKKDGLAVMIAVGSPKKPGGGMMDGGKTPMDMRASKMAVGGAGKTRKGQAPIKKAMGGKACAEGGEMMKPVKRAQGGAGKVRKGMMTPEGQITHAMNKLRGK
jgi:hypothetical protein